jgi:hypothetical protein
MDRSVQVFGQSVSMFANNQLDSCVMFDDMVQEADEQLQDIAIVQAVIRLARPGSTASLYSCGLSMQSELEFVRDIARRMLSDEPVTISAMNVGPNGEQREFSSRSVGSLADVREVIADLSWWRPITGTTVVSLRAGDRFAVQVVGVGRDPLPDSLRPSERSVVLVRAGEAAATRVGLTIAEMRPTTSGAVAPVQSEGC